jgi:uncharacterized protein YkwD
MREGIFSLKKFRIVFLSALFFMLLTPNVFAAENCEGITPETKIWWDGAELKVGQIGRLTVVQNTPLYKLDGERESYSRTLKSGENYRIYAFKPGRLSVGGGLYVDRDVRVKYETPSQAKKNLLACKAQAIKNQGKTIAINEVKTSVEAKFGKEKRASLNEYNLNWYAYHNNYKDFYMVSYINNVVKGIYTNDSDFYVQGIHVGSTTLDVKNALGQPVKGILKGYTNYLVENNQESQTYFYDNQYITIFYDIHNGGKVTSILAVTGTMEMMKQNQYGTPSTSLQTGFEMQMYDVTNAVRAKFGLKPLGWEEKARTSSRLHSQDMAINDYFSHTSQKGLSPFDRMESAGIRYIYAGENIAMGFPSSIFAHEALMNSLGHRKNILNINYTHVGMGVQFQETTRVPYYTQNFLTPQ